jgi:biopolymer transport protein ExbB/TolQ
LGSLIDFYARGGVFMHPILLSMLVALAIAIERLIRVMVKSRIDTTAFVSRILEYIQRNNIKGDVDFCSHSAAPLPRIIRAGLVETGKPPADIQHAIETATMDEIPKLEKRTHYLSTLSNIAPLLGLLGTILGLIHSFAAIAQADAAVKVTMLSAGISEVMSTTAFGLVVAIFCMITYAFIQEKTNELIDDINKNAAIVYKRLTMVRGQ